MSLEKIKEQLEFYFSDSNFSKDKFMQAKAKENEGYIPISVFLTFKRMQTLDADASKIKDALKDSKVIEVNNENLRKIETKEYTEYLNLPDLSDRIIYIKGFDEDMGLDEIQGIIKKYFDPIKVTLRRDKFKKFKGSCFVECSSAEEAKKILEIKMSIDSSKESGESKRSKSENFLEIMTKSDYLNIYKKDEQSKKDDAFAEKVKASFIPRLFKYECDQTFTIEDIKSVIKDSAFVDVIKKVVRLKYLDERDSFEVEIKKDGKTHVLKMIKFTEEEGKDYVKNLTIKRNSNKKVRN